MPTAACRPGRVSTAGEIDPRPVPRRHAGAGLVFVAGQLPIRLHGLRLTEASVRSGARDHSSHSIGSSDINRTPVRVNQLVPGSVS